MNLFATINDHPDHLPDVIPSSVSSNLTIHAVGENSLVGVAIKDNDRPAFYMPIGHYGGGNIDAAAANRFLLTALRGCTLTAWDCKNVSNLLYEFGIDTASLGIQWNEVQFKAALCNSQRKKTGFADTCKDFKVPYDALPNRTDNAEFIQLTHANNVAPHARQDVVTVAALDRTIEVPSECNQVLDLENEVVHVTISMERAGLRIDEELLERYLKESSERESVSQSRFNKLLGRQCDVNNVSDLRALFRQQGVRLPGAAKPGELSFARRSIQDIKDPIVREILDLRSVCHLRRKYLLNYSAQLRGGYVFPKFHQMKGDWGSKGSSISLLMGNESTKGMVSGLYSLTDPAVTQAYDPEKQIELMGPTWLVRKLFLPGEGQFFSSDASQIEMRIFAHQTGDRLFINALDKGLDPHVWIGKQCRLERKQAKLTNYLCLYGGGETALSEALNISIEEASLIMEKYHAGFSLSRKSARWWQKEAKRNGFVESKLGRRRHYNTGDRIYTALNSYIQMTRADIMKLKLWALHPLESMIGFKIRFVSSDEICGDLINPNALQELKEMMACQEMEIKPTTQWKTRTGPNWCDLSSVA